MVDTSKKVKFNRILAWLDMIIKDHGFLRFCYHNFHQVDEKLYRSNMPTPLRIKQYAKLGIKTIINLRREAQTHHTNEQLSLQLKGFTWVL